MAAPDPEQLFQQAESLVSPPAAPPGALIPVREENIRRAISATYYGLFHTVLSALADMIVGLPNRTTPEYGLVYRSVEHKAVRAVSNGVLELFRSRSQPNHPFLPYAPAGGDLVSLSRILRLL